MPFPVNTTSCITFLRHPALAGLELRQVENSDRSWGFLNTDYQFLISTSWTGMVWHRQRDELLAPGRMLCARPGELLLARTGDQGKVLCISVEPELLKASAPLQDLTSGCQFRSLAHVSLCLSTAIEALTASLQQGGAAAQATDALSAFVDSMFAEYAETPREPTTQGMDATRELLRQFEEEQVTHMNLSTLSRQTGLSRFAALRAFKRRYGLPPHSYQLHVRLGLAQRGLREGQSPARVAAIYGFVDQSHLTRHFKRILGVTPAHYARVGGRLLAANNYESGGKPGTFPARRRSQIGGSASSSDRKSTVARTFVDNWRADGYTAKIAAGSNS